MCPWLTANPANGMIASLGTGMQALSSSISKKTAGSPELPMRWVAHSTTLLMMDAVMGEAYPTRLRAVERPSLAVARSGALW